MNIGLLISEIEDQEVKRIIVGANQAANDKGITLVIMPGKYLPSDTSDKTYDYQNSALFDYAVGSDFDALIIDADRIGSNTTILKKEAFLKKFEGIPVITLTEQEGFECVNQVESDNDYFEQLGYEAVCDAAFYAKNQVLPPAAKSQQFNYVRGTETEAINALCMMNNIMLRNKYDEDGDFSTITKMSISHGVKTFGILLFDTKVRNTVKYPWKRPDQISIKSAAILGKEINSGDSNISIATDKIVTTLTNGNTGTFIMGCLYVGEYQLGLMINEFSPIILIDNYYDSVISLITGVSRLSYLEKELIKTTEELYEVQEELARDDSVLDHIGDQDYLTGGLNRRGFFAKAYDLLKERFAPGKCALVAYIHMDSLKSINDMYGHEEGDRAVRRISQILDNVFSDGIYGRIRGDEFAVIVIADGEGKAESLREQMSDQNAKLLSESSRYINHLQYSICEFGYEENLSLREMLKETDENLQRIRGNM
jgi:diguanylate cyclase (GGDEF)-like protein